MEGKHPSVIRQFYVADWVDETTPDDDSLASAKVAFERTSRHLGMKFGAISRDREAEKPYGRRDGKVIRIYLAPAGDAA